MLKDLIKYRKIKDAEKPVPPAANLEFEIPGEPMPYSIKYGVGKRTRDIRFFRNKQWSSILKCHFLAFHHAYTPVVVLVRFYCSPPDDVEIDADKIKKEQTPAVFCLEPCEYGLSFLEMLKDVLMKTYRQVVKLDIEKYYSNKPRTVFKFMKWDHYVKFRDSNTLHSETKRISKMGKKRSVQPQLRGHEASKGVGPVSAPISSGTRRTTPELSSSSNNAVQDSGSSCCSG